MGLGIGLPGPFSVHIPIGGRRRSPAPKKRPNSDDDGEWLFIVVWLLLAAVGIVVWLTAWALILIGAPFTLTGQALRRSLHHIGRAMDSVDSGAQAHADLTKSKGKK